MKSRSPETSLSLPQAHGKFFKSTVSIGASSAWSHASKCLPNASEKHRRLLPAILISSIPLNMTEALCSWCGAAVDPEVDDQIEAECSIEACGTRTYHVE